LQSSKALSDPDVIWLFKDHGCCISYQQCSA